MSDQEQRDAEVTGLIPPAWDRTAYDWMLKLRDQAATLPGVKISGSGTGDGTADFSFVVDGCTYWVTVQSLGGKPS